MELTNFGTLQIFRLKGCIALIIIAVVDAFHIDLTAIDFVGQGIFQNILYFNIFNRTALHSEQIVLFINLAPIDNLAEFLFENAIKPNACASAVALTERVGNIHFHIFFYNLVKG